MVWTEDHEEMLLREILTYEPFNHKLGTGPRGEAWKMIAETLNGLDCPKFSVNHRSVREKYSAMEKTHKKKMADEEKASGINPDDLTSKEKALDEIIRRFADIELATELDCQNSSKAVEKERQTAAEVRKQSMETYSETKKRNANEDDSSPSSSKKRRKTPDDTHKYLREKMEMEKGFRERELKIAETRENTLQQLILQQQQQNQAMLSLLLQQQQQNSSTGNV